MSAFQKHPERPGTTAIDYKLIRVVFPTFLVGSYFGVLVSVFLGDLPLAVALCLLLLALGI